MKMISPLILTVAAVSGGAAFAQKDTSVAQERQPPTMRTPDYALLDDVLGAKVLIQPGAEARREATEENEKVKRPSGEVKDLILECKSGNIECAVVSFGGVLGLGDKTVALPVALLSWNALDKRYDLAASEDQLKALPAFDLKEARKRGLDNEIVVLRSSWSKFGVPPSDAAARTSGIPEEASRKTSGESATERTEGTPKVQDSPHKGTTVAGTSFVVVPGRFVVASEVDDYPVYAMGEKFGKIQKCIVDRNARTLAFCVVSHGGTLGIGDTEYVVPHRAMSLCRDGDNNIYVISRSADQLKTGVKYEKPKQGGALDPDAAKRAETMY